MTIDQLVNQLKKDEAIFPKELLSEATFNELVKLTAKVYENEKYRNEIVHNKYFYNNYFNLINYLYVVHLNEKKKNSKKQVFDTNLINNLLSLPEPA